MMTHVVFDDDFRKKFWCEAISTATKLDNIMARNMGSKPPCSKFFKEYPKYRNHLRIFGEMAVVANHEKNLQEPKLNKEKKQQCLLDMLMITLEMFIDSFI